MNRRLAKQNTINSIRRGRGILRKTRGAQANCGQPDHKNAERKLEDRFMRRKAGHPT